MPVDGHEDLALDALSYGRDYLGSTALEIRAREDVAPVGGQCMLSLADWQRQGAESAPAGFDTIADLATLRDALGDAILGGRLRWLRAWL